MQGVLLVGEHMVSGLAMLPVARGLGMAPARLQT